MTPIEIADWLDALVVDEVDYEERIIHKAAATIRAQAEALKIATEALEGLHSTIANAFPALSKSGPMVAASQAIARIKEG